MKYKCINECLYNNSTIMSPGDIIVMDGNKLFNVSTGIDCYVGDDSDGVVKSCLVEITDESRKAASKVTDIDRFEDVTKKMLNIFRTKNHDYGNSFEQSLNEEGLAASRIRMGDKWNRYKTLSRPRMDAQVNDESIRDTLLDLANYAIMTVIWLDKQNGNI